MVWPQFTHIEEPCCYAVPSAQLFKGIWLIFLWRESISGFRHINGTKHFLCINMCESQWVLPSQSQSEVRIDHQHHNLQPNGDQ